MGTSSPHWWHQVSREWMMARKDHLTGSEVASLHAALMKATEKSKKAGLVPAFVKLWGKKHSSAEPNLLSTGAAARGHILEPYAIEAYMEEAAIGQAFHWDDCLIHNGLIAFSPDGLDVPQPPDVVSIDIKEFEPPTVLFEIKSYEEDHHYECLFSEDKMSALFKSERQQMAVGMYVCPSIETACLILFNPDVYEGHRMKVIKYTREDLENELKGVEEVLDMWKKTDEVMKTTNFGWEVNITSDQIWEEAYGSNC